MASELQRCLRQELLGQVGHYSERVRIGGLSGIGDLLTRHPDQASRAAGPLLDALAPRILDSDEGVRKALQLLLTSQAGIAHMQQPDPSRGTAHECLA